MIEGRGFRPFALEHVQVFVAAQVALGLQRMDVPVARHLFIGAAGNDVYRNASAGKLVQRGKLPRRQRRLRETGPVRHKETEARGDRRGMGGDDLALRRTGTEGNQHPVEPARFLRAGGRVHIVTVQHA